MVFSYSFNERRITNNEQPASQLNTPDCLLLTEYCLLLTTYCKLKTNKVRSPEKNSTEFFLAKKNALHFSLVLAFFHNLNPPLGALPRTEVRGFYAPRPERRVQGMENARFNAKIIILAECQNALHFVISLALKRGVLRVFHKLKSFKEASFQAHRNITAQRQDVYILYLVCDCLHWRLAYSRISNFFNYRRQVGAHNIKHLFLPDCAIVVQLDDIALQTLWQVHRLHECVDCFFADCKFVMAVRNFFR